MNKARRKELREVIFKLRRVQDKEDLMSCINALDNLKYEEESYYDNIPENLQGSFRAEQSVEALDNLEDALDILNDALDEENMESVIRTAIDKIEEAIF